MIQIYFLSIVSNFAVGLFLVAPYLGRNIQSFEALALGIDARPMLKLLTGFAAMIISFVKLINVYAASIIILGDFFPAVIGLLGGFVLVVEYFFDEAKEQSPFMEAIDKIFLKNKTIIGAVALLIAILHFFLPGVLFL